MSGEVLIDVTELGRSAVRTGIQRVTWEAFTRWPDRSRLIPFRLLADGTPVALDRHEVRGLSPGFASLAPASGSGTPARGEALLRGRRILNSEVFYEPARLAFYERLLERRPDDVHFVLFDFLPQLRPGLFPRGATAHTMRYVRLVRSARHVSFISAATRRAYLERICRDPTRPVGPVLPLGADGLGVAEAEFDPGRRGVAVVGTLEPRKCPDRILSAFELLWARGVRAPLTFVGRAGWLEAPALARIERAAEAGAIRWIRTADDATLRRTIRESRATLFASQAEGYGLPPVESLALGVPVIASADLPSLEGVEHGVITLSALEPPAIAATVESLLDDDVAAAKYAELVGRRPRTWAGFASDLARWIARGPAAVTR